MDIKIISAIISIIIVVIFSRDAFAYLDPGTGSMLLQGLAFVFFGFLFFFKRIYKSIRRFFFSSKKTISNSANKDLGE